MAGLVHPFAALRPGAEYAARVAALPYDVMSTEEAREMAMGNPHSFLRVDKAEIEFPPGTAFNEPAVYEKARANLNGLVAGHILARDDKPCFYIYRLTMHTQVQTGLACCVNTADYESGKIKKHEFTRPDKEQDRVEHITACRAHTGPIFLTYRAVPEIRQILHNWINNNKAVYDFTADGDVRHEMWVINDETAIQAVTDAFGQVPCLYIADGHHRSAAAVRAGGASRFLAVAFPHDELRILDYNRVVTDLHGLTVSAFLQALERDFHINNENEPVKPSKTHEYGLYLGGHWYRLAYKHPAPADAVKGLAVSVLQNAVLAPLLGIQDPRRDKRIDFVGGIRGTEGLTNRVNSGEMALAFTLCPTGLEELMAVADAGRVMPPKSTWFEPKLLSGLLIHMF
jgi:uncharacterized protein (DUF1015 family)